MIKRIVGWFKKTLKKEQREYLVFDPSREVTHRNMIRGYLDVFSCEGIFLKSKEDVLEFISDTIPKKDQKSVIVFKRITPKMDEEKKA